MHGEFAFKRLKCREVFSPFVCRAVQKGRNSLIFSLLSGNFAPRPGSMSAASSARPFCNKEIIVPAGALIHSPATPFVTPWGLAKAATSASFAAAPFTAGAESPTPACGLAACANRKHLAMSLPTWNSLPARGLAIQLDALIETLIVTPAPGVAFCRMIPAPSIQVPA